MKKMIIFKVKVDQSIKIIQMRVFLYIVGFNVNFNQTIFKLNIIFKFFLILNNQIRFEIFLRKKYRKYGV